MQIFILPLRSTTCRSSVILEAVLVWSHHVPALVLRHLDLPLPGGGRGARVYVDVDGVAGVGGGHPHVLSSVVATDNGRFTAFGSVVND